MSTVTGGPTDMPLVVLG